MAVVLGGFLSRGPGRDFGCEVEGIDEGGGGLLGAEEVLVTMRVMPASFKRELEVPWKAFGGRGGGEGARFAEAAFWAGSMSAWRRMMMAYALMKGAERQGPRLCVEAVWEFVGHLAATGNRGANHDKLRQTCIRFIVALPFI